MKKVWDRWEAMVGDLEFNEWIEMLASQIDEDLLVKQLNMWIICLNRDGARGESESKTLRNARREKNKASSVSHNIDENLEGTTLNGHLKQEFTLSYVRGGIFQVENTERDSRKGQKIIWLWQENLEINIKYA